MSANMRLFRDQVMKRAHFIQQGFKNRSHGYASEVDGICEFALELGIINKNIDYLARNWIKKVVTLRQIQRESDEKAEKLAWLAFETALETQRGI